MEKGQMKMLGIVCLVVCAVCLFIAFERYQSNAKQVQAMKHMLNNNSSPLGGMMGGVKVRATTPAATKYALFFALITGVGGGVLLAKSQPVKAAEDLSVS